MSEKKPRFVEGRIRRTRNTSRTCNVKSGFFPAPRSTYDLELDHAATCCTVFTSHASDLCIFGRVFFTSPKKGVGIRGRANAGANSWHTHNRSVAWAPPAGSPRCHVSNCSNGENRTQWQCAQGGFGGKAKSNKSSTRTSHEGKSIQVKSSQVCSLGGEGGGSLSGEEEEDGGEEVEGGDRIE